MSEFKLLTLQENKTNIIFFMSRGKWNHNVAPKGVEILGSTIFGSKSILEKEPIHEPVTITKKN